jgi:hypothetical protein
MRRLILVAAGTAVLATAGLALAKGFGPAKSVEVSATFTATNAAKVETKTCTTSDGRTITVSQGTYTGTATGDPDLTGPITLMARSTVDSTAGVGVVSGRVRIDTPGHDTLAALTAVYDHGSIAGLVGGLARSPRARLLGNTSADFSAAGGFMNGKIGGSAGGSAIELGPTRCAPTHPTKEESAARGTVSALSTSSITVAGLTCTVPDELSTKVTAALHVGDHAEIHCRLVSNVNTLVRFQKHR